jgi:hypothetical protein
MKGREQTNTLASSAFFPHTGQAYIERRTNGWKISKLTGGPVTTV